MEKLEDSLIIETYDDLAQTMLQCSGYGVLISAILPYEGARQLVKELATYEDTSIGSLELYDSMWDGYDKEYCVCVDDDMQISVEKAWHDKNEFHKAGYYDFDNELVFISADSDTGELLKHITNSLCYEVEVCENICTCDECPLKGDDLEDILEYIVDNLY